MGRRALVVVHESREASSARGALNRLTRSFSGCETRNPPRRADNHHRCNSCNLNPQAFLMISTPAGTSAASRLGYEYACKRNVSLDVMQREARGRHLAACNGARIITFFRNPHVGSKGCEAWGVASFILGGCFRNWCLPVGEMRAPLSQTPCVASGWSLRRRVEIQIKQPIVAVLAAGALHGVWELGGRELGGVAFVWSSHLFHDLEISGYGLLIWNLTQGTGEPSATNCRRLNVDQLITDGKQPSGHALIYHDFPTAG